MNSPIGEELNFSSQDKLEVSVEEERIVFLGVCPRCGERGYEGLSTHAYCVECNYAPEFEPGFYVQFPDAVLAKAEELGLKGKTGSAEKTRSLEAA